MGHYAGLGKVDWAGAIGNGLANTGKALTQYNDAENERLRKKQEEERNKKLSEIQYGNYVQQSQIFKNQQEELDLNKPLNAFKRALETKQLAINGRKQALEANELGQKEKNQLTALEEQQKDFENKKAIAELNRQSDLLAARVETGKLEAQERAALDNLHSQLASVYSGQTTIDKVNKTFNLDLSDLKQLDDGVYKAKSKGQTVYQINHPDLNGAEDMAFSIRVDQAMQSIPEAERDKVAVLLNRALKKGKDADPEAKAQLYNNYKGIHDNLINYSDKFDPNAKLTAKISKLTDYRNEYALSLKGAPDTSGELARIDGEINAMEGLIISNNKPIGGGAGGTSTKKDQSNTQSTGIGNFARPSTLGKPVVPVSQSTEANQAPWVAETIKKQSVRLLAEKVSEAIYNDYKKIHGQESSISPEELKKAKEEALSKLPANPTTDQLTTVSKEIVKKLKKAPDKFSKSAIMQTIGNYP